jgi:hypothetical protein
VPKPLKVKIQWFFSKKWPILALKPHGTKTAYSFTVQVLS